MAFIQDINLATVETMLVSVPESIGLLVFGVVLAAAAVGIRSLLASRDVEVTKNLR